MTNEEMNELKGLAASMGLYDDKNPCKRAVILGKAIKTLEQEPCDNAISRQAALDEIRKCRFVVDAIEKNKRIATRHTAEEDGEVDKKPG